MDPTYQVPQVNLSYKAPGIITGINPSPKMPKIYAGFSLQGKKKHSGENKVENVSKFIKAIHRSVDWPMEADGLSITRFKQVTSRSVLAVSKEGKILGYAIARDDSGSKVSDKRYYLSFIAVEKGSQGKKIGEYLLMRLFEKIIKKKGVYVCLEFEDTEKLRKFYQNPSIPYASKLHRKIGTICCNTQEKYQDKNMIEYFLNQPKAKSPT